MDLSVIIPARNEMFLKNTVEDILKNRRANTEIIIIADGAWPIEPIDDHPDVHMIFHSESVGQRAATNEGAKLSRAKYIMKLDAHCAVDEGFDVKLMADCEYDWTVVPRMYNLHVFNRVCNACGAVSYQGPTECPTCGSKDITRDIVWTPRWNRESDFARFDKSLHFQYWGQYKARPEAQGDIADLMTSVGACFFMHRERFWDLGGLDENHGSWGQFGVEVACKAWLSGGRHVVNKKTWFAHMFRTQGKDFGFPYPLSNSDVERARKYSRMLWTHNQWDKAIRPFTWIIDKFAPIPDWHDASTPAPVVDTVPAPAAEEVTESVALTTGINKKTKGIVYYTDNRLDDDLIGEVVRHQLRSTGLPITSVSLKPIDFGQNIVLPLERGYLTMFKQILAGLEACTADIVFFCEHDVIYHVSHFDFVPPEMTRYYYNMNTWKVNADTGHAITYETKQLSGLCAYRDILIEHYRERVRRVERDGFSRAMGFEPGSHRRKERVDDRSSDTWLSPMPNVDVRHHKNLTANRWRQDQFRDQRNCQGWQEASAIPGWGQTEGRFQEWMLDLLSD